MSLLYFAFIAYVVETRQRSRLLLMCYIGFFGIRLKLGSYYFFLDIDSSGKRLLRAVVVLFHHDEKYEAQVWRLTPTSYKKKQFFHIKKTLI